MAISGHFLPRQTLFLCAHREEKTMSDFMDYITSASVFVFLMSVLIFV